LYNHAVHLVSSSTALSKKPKSASPSAIQVKLWRKTIGNKEKLHVISQLETDERIVDICRNVRLAHSSVHTIRDNVDRSEESAKSGSKMFFF
jgi:hypothetical protein